MKTKLKSETCYLVVTHTFGNVINAYNVCKTLKEARELKKSLDFPFKHKDSCFIVKQTKTFERRS